MRKLFQFVLAMSCLTPSFLAAGSQPNVIIIFADDLGYGDLGCYGHPTIATPNIDRMASQGQRWTSFYSASSVCTPSRASLLTGRLPIRSGMTSPTPRVLGSRSLGGLPDSEVTIAELLKEKNYATAIIGKWHLGHLPEFLPSQQGFDEYYGLPSSNDHNATFGKELAATANYEPKIEYWDIPLLHNGKIIERPVDQHTLTKRYTEQAIQFIRKHSKESFFLYLAHTMPHTPLFRSSEYVGKSIRGVFGDVLAEIDWSVGQVLETLRNEGIAENTLVVFTSDNGPWLIRGSHGGSAGLLRDGKGSTWEGGMRVPAIFWWPGKVQASTVRSMGSTLDILPTVASLAGADSSQCKPLDGYDLSSVLLGQSNDVRKEMFFYRGGTLYAVRLGPYKAHFLTQIGYNQPNPEKHDPPLLFQLEQDPSEEYDVAKAHPEILKEIQSLVKRHQATIVPVENQLTKQADGPTGVFAH